MITYNVYRNGEKIASDLTEKTYTDTNLTPNTEYSYQVSSENEHGESPLTSPVVIRTNYSEPESIEVSPKTNNLKVGATRNLTATVNPSTAKQTVIWSSLDDAIASVDENGTVTANNPGTTTINVKSTENDISTTATVNVTQPVESVHLEPKTAEIEVGEEIKLAVTILPSNASNKNYTFSTNRSSVALASQDGTVKGVSGGTATITVTTEDGGKTDTAEITVNEPEPE